MQLFRLVAHGIGFALAVLGVAAVSAQDYPNKPVRILTGGAGSNADIISRLVAQGISGPLGQQVIVDNRVSGIPLGSAAAKSPPDGYTLLVTSSSMWLLPFLQDNVPFDPIADFAPVSLLVSSPNILVVHPSLPVKSVKEIIALAKARPGVLNYASGVDGATPHLAAELFNSMARVNVVKVNYKGAGPALTGVVSGESDLMFATASGVTPHIKSGRLRAVAVTSAEPSTLMPDLPTVASAGLRGYEVVAMSGMFAPVKTSTVVINRLNQEIVRYLALPNTKAQLLNTGADAVGSSPEQFGAKVKAEMAALGKIIKDARPKSN